jgi:hypothetical protein
MALRNSKQSNAPRPRISLRWIISAREDLVWFIGSVAVELSPARVICDRRPPADPMVAGWAI